MKAPRYLDPNPAILAQRPEGGYTTAYAQRLGVALIKLGWRPWTPKRGPVAGVNYRYYPPRLPDRSLVSAFIAISGEGQIELEGHEAQIMLERAAALVSAELGHAVAGQGGAK